MSHVSVSIVTATLSTRRGIRYEVFRVIMLEDNLYLLVRHLLRCAGLERHKTATKAGPADRARRYADSPGSASPSKRPWSRQTPCLCPLAGSRAAPPWRGRCWSGWAAGVRGPFGGARAGRQPHQAPWKRPAIPYESATKSITQGKCETCVSHEKTPSRSCSSWMVLS